jgi:hypothetical protein
VAESYGDEAAKALPKGVTARDGLHPDLVAEVFGYSNGKELIDAISHAPAKDALIKQQTDARMQLEHGERLSDLQVRDAAEEAVRNEKREVVLRKELEFLASDQATLKGLVRAVTRNGPADRSDPRRSQSDHRLPRTSATSGRSSSSAQLRRLATEAREALLEGRRRRGVQRQAEGAADERSLPRGGRREAVDRRCARRLPKVFRKDEQLSKTRDWIS